MAKFSPLGYIRSVVEEGKKVVWPSRELVIRHSIMVVVTVAIAVVVVAGVDLGLQKLVVLAINKGN